MEQQKKSTRNHLDLLRETYIEINLDHIEHNIRAIRKMCGTETSIGAVIKADAYGHGALALAPVLMENGADFLCVATLSEGIEVKQHFPDYPVLLMGLTQSAYFDYVLQYDLIQTIDRFDQAQALSQAAAKHKKTARIHLKIDTGFHRLGFLVNEESIDQTSLCVELDVFEAPFAPLIIAEVEFPSEEMANAFLPLDWFDQDVTNDPSYHNSNLSRQAVSK